MQILRMPISSVEQLDALDLNEIIEGYWSGRDGEREPGNNRSISFWHGWRNGMADSGRMPIDAHMRQLAHEVVEKGRKSA